MWAAITKPFAWLMMWLYSWTQNYGISVILFALVVNLILMPFMGKSKKSMMRTSRLQPKIQELQRRHEGNQQKLNMEMQKLYKEEGVNPMSGCLWSLIPFPILIALYSVIRQPLTRMMGLSSETATVITNYFTDAGLYTAATGRSSAYSEITITQLCHDHFADIQQYLTNQGVADISKLKDIDYHFLGLNLGDIPNWHFFTSCDWSAASSWLPALGLFLIPLIAAFLSWLSMKVSNLSNPQTDVQTQSTMKSMNIMMPLMSIWICFVMPAALGVYWIANSIFGMARDYSLTKIFKAQLDKEDAEKIAARNAREKELADKHANTVRMKAEGKSQVNTNTSKKKIQAQKTQDRDERRAAAAKQEKEEKKARRGIVDEEKKDASEVGGRRYARGRAYDPNRYKD